MANVTAMKLVVEKLTRFGVKAVGIERPFNYSQKLDEAVKAKVVPGMALEAEIYTSDKGAQYLNSAKILATETPKDEAKLDLSKGVDLRKDSDPERTRKFTPSFKKDVSDPDKMTKADWASKDRSQLVGGRSHDAAILVQSALTVGVSVDTALKMYKDALDGILKIAEEVK